MEQTPHITDIALEWDCAAYADDPKFVASMRFLACQAARRDFELQQVLNKEKFDES